MALLSRWRLALVLLAGLVPASARAVPWPLEVSLTQCMPQGRGVACSAWLPLEAERGGLLRDQASGVPAGRWSVSGGQLTLLFAADLDGDGVLDPVSRFEGPIDPATGCADGTWTDHLGRAGTFTACL